MQHLLINDATIQLTALKQKRKTTQHYRPIKDIDMIFTWSGGGACACCMAYHSGLQYGFRSTDKPCTLHDAIFVDNHYHKYNHQKHVAVVAQHRPKYATVRDLMTETQCKEAGIPFYSFDEVMRFAEEMEQYTEHVIVIPKYDCIADIPQKYVLGYSVPTSYGGTPLETAHFKGRKVHLLGGEPRLQHEYWQLLKDEIVSIDNNYIHLLSQKGQILNHENKWVRLQEVDITFDKVDRPFYMAFAYNLIKIRQMFVSGQIVDGSIN